MPPRRTRQLKSLKSRVQRLTTRDDYDKFVRKSYKRLVVILHVTSSIAPQQLSSIRAHIGAISKRNELKNVSFGELDASQPDFQDLTGVSSIATYPAYQLLRNGQPIEVLTGMQLNALAQRCMETAGKSDAEPTSRWKKLLLATVLIGTVAAAGYFGYQHTQNNASTPDEQIADLDSKIKDANARLAYLTRRKQHKAKREQQKKITALEDRRQAIMRTQQALVSKPVLQRQTFSDEDSSDSDSD